VQDRHTGGFPGKLDSPGERFRGIFNRELGLGANWKTLRVQCENRSCTGEWNPRTDETKPYRMAHIGRRFWAHGFRCPGCGHTLWLQSEPWSRSPYDRSPIQGWGFSAYAFIISFLAVLAGIVVHFFSGKAGFYLLVPATAGVFIGGIGLVRKDVQEVAAGQKASYDMRLLFPLFSSAILFPVLFLAMEPEALLLWGVPGCIAVGYLAGSLRETRFS
jgi:hypothetical protein